MFYVYYRFVIGVCIPNPTNFFSAKNITTPKISRLRKHFSLFDLEAP